MLNRNKNSRVICKIANQYKKGSISKQVYKEELADFVCIRIQNNIYTQLDNAMMYMERALNNG